MKKVKVRIIKPEQIPHAHEVRTRVFQQEQGIAQERDFDGEDEKALQAVAYIDREPVATARVRFPHSPREAKIERVATLKEHRGKGIGKEIMLFLEEHLKKIGVKTMYLESQMDAKDFYNKLGYEDVGEPFEDVGIPHIKMVKHI